MVMPACRNVRVHVKWLLAIVIISNESEGNMRILIRFFLSASRKRRCMAIKAALWLLRQVYDLEKGEVYRYSDKLDQFELVYGSDSWHEYNAMEEEYINCECALGFLDSAIEDLEFAYCERF